MMRARKPLCLLFAVILMLSSCSHVPDEPVISVSATEEITTSEETTSAPPPVTEEITEEVTDEITEEMTDEVTDEVTEEETTESVGLEILSADEILLITQHLANIYRSYTRVTETSIAIDILGSKSYSETESELRVNEDNATFRRGGEDGFDYLYLVGGELYYELSLGKCRVGGYDRGSFLELVTDSELMNSFLNGTVTEDGEGFLISFSGLDDDGRSSVISMLGLPDGYSVSFGDTLLEIRTDSKANLLSSRMTVSLSVGMNGETLMEIIMTSTSEQSGIGQEIYLDLPDPEEYIFFTDQETMMLYGDLVGDIKGFTSAYSKYEYSVRDDMSVSSGTISLPLTSKTVYAYNSRIGASIDKSFDLGDGTGVHTTLTHFNNRRGFSQIDGGSIFVDTTVNADNLMFTLSYPFTTSFFSLEHCIGMDAELSDGSMLALTLNEKAAKNIAGNLLLRVGVFSSDPELTDTKAYTYIKLDAEGRISSIGYEFSSRATVSGIVYTLTRSVELEIVSRDAANVKVIYINVDEDE